MKRFVLALALLFSFVAPEIVHAQTGDPRIRLRWSTSRRPGSVELPIVQINSPTSEPTFTTSVETLVLQGGVLSTSNSPIVEVRWTCPTCSPTSGVASLANPWVTSSSSEGGGETVVVQETFTGSTNVRLSDTFATPIGGAWPEVVNTTGGNTFFLERRASGYVQINSNLGNNTIANVVQPATALSGTNYNVSVTLRHIENPDSDDGAAIIFGYVDSSNYCTVLLYGPAANPDLYITKTVAGVQSAVGPGVDIDPAAGDVITLEARGDDFTVKRAGVTLLTESSGDCDNGTGVGLGLGGFRGVAGDDAAARWRLDDFTVTDQGGGGGVITLAPGANVITVFAKDGLDNEDSDTITVTLEVADTQLPQATIIAPVNTPNYTVPPSAPTFSVVVQCLDNIACTEATWERAECEVSSGSATQAANGTWSFSITACEGTNTIVVTAKDAAENEHQDTLVATLDSGDSTPPIINITTNGGSSFSTIESSREIRGTASDDSGSVTVTGSCTNGTLAPISGSGSWSGVVALAPGPNACTFTARDPNNNTAQASITVTYNAPIAITTSSITVVEDVALGSNACILTTGGSGTKEFSRLSGTYPAGVDLNTSTGCFTGTPTTAETQSLSMRVTDDAGFADKTISFVVQAAGTGPHAYYESLRTSSECFKAYSMRPQAGQTTPVNTTAGVADCTNHRWASQLATGRFFPTFNWVSYCFTGTEPNCGGVADDDPQKQDAMKQEVQVFNPVGMWEADNNASTNTTVLGEAITANQTQFKILHGNMAWERGKSFLIGGWPGGEIVTIDVYCKDLVVNGVCQYTGKRHPTTDTVTVSRGQFGTTAQEWPAGQPVQRNDNGLQDNNRFLQIKTDGSISATYLLTWDTYWADGYNGTGMAAHKFNQISSHNQGDQWAEFKPLYQGDTNPTAYQQGVDVGTLGFRWYAQSLRQGFFQEPGAPLTDENDDPTVGFIIKPNTWTRVWMLVEANAETDTSKFVNSGQRLITPEGMAAESGTTSITISHDLGTAPWFLGGTIRPNRTNPFTSSHGITEGANQAWPGRRIKIDDEIMTVVSGQVADEKIKTRTLTVRRGQDGTTPAVHAVDAPIYVIDDYVSIWIADENNNARMITNRLSLFIPIDSPTLALRGQLGTFWIEADTSHQELPLARVQQLNNERGGDLVSYSRNLVVLKNPTGCTASDCSAFLIPPVR